MKIKKGEIRVELSTDEIDALMSAAKVLRELHYEMVQNNCTTGYAEKEGYVFSTISVDNTRMELEHLTKITNMY